jgi:hypothetical protein
MKTKKTYIGMDSEGRLDEYSLDTGKQSFVIHFIRQHARFYTVKSLEKAGVRMVPCQLHFPVPSSLRSPGVKCGWIILKKSGAPLYHTFYRTQRGSLAALNRRLFGEDADTTRRQLRDHGLCFVRAQLHLQPFRK